MITSLSATGFRGFRSISIRDLRPVNILVGASASGKTALLEAIRLAAGATPNVAWQLNATRTLPLLAFPNPTRDQFEGLFSSLFYDFDVTHRIQLSINDRELGLAAVDIYFDQDKQIAPLPQPPTGQVGFPVLPLAFKRFNFRGEESIFYANLNSQGQLNLDGAPELGPRIEFFTSAWQANGQQIASWYSTLSIANKEAEITRAVRKQFPQIEDLTVQNPTNFISSIYATLPHLSHKLPVSLVSSGINKFISLLIGISATAGGVLLIDEIENGIYYRLFESLWKALHSFARANGTQLFLSTHSLECLRGVTPLIQSDAEDFSLIQMTTRTGESEAFVVPGEDAYAAIEGGVEVRG
jgi:hypothetical protein